MSMVTISLVLEVPISLTGSNGALGEIYELTKRGRMGPGDGDLKQATLLNRVITWTEEGLELEADPRQAERLVRQLGVEGANTLLTPGVKTSIQYVIADVPHGVEAGGRVQVLSRQQQLYVAGPAGVPIRDKRSVAGLWRCRRKWPIEP